MAGRSIGAGRALAGCAVVAVMAMTTQPAQAGDGGVDRTTVASGDRGADGGTGGTVAGALGGVGGAVGAAVGGVAGAATGAVPHAAGTAAGPGHGASGPGHGAAGGPVRNTVHHAVHHAVGTVTHAVGTVAGSAADPVRGTVGHVVHHTAGTAPTPPDGAGDGAGDTAGRSDGDARPPSAAPVAHHQASAPASVPVSASAAAPDGAPAGRRPPRPAGAGEHMTPEEAAHALIDAVAGTGPGPVPGMAAAAGAPRQDAATSARAGASQACRGASLAAADLRRCALVDVLLPNTGGPRMLLVPVGLVLTGLGVLMIVRGRRRRLPGRPRDRHRTPSRRIFAPTRPGAG